MSELVAKRQLPPDTPEQAKITNFKGQKLVVKAFAGTGKTTTLEKFALKNTGVRLLYIAFQRSVADEAAARFPSNVTCRTSHQIAYAAIGKKYRHKQRPQGLTLSDIARVIGNKDWRTIKDIMATLSSFLSSADHSVLLGHTPHNDLPRALSPVELRYKAQLVEIAQVLWEKMIDLEDSFPMTHDGYLKLYQLSKPDLSLRYGMILFDEAQDANPVTTALVLAQRCPIIFVGDSHQQIYRFRGADNALDIPEMKDATQLRLTNSFRFGPEVSLVANAILALKGETTPLVGRGKPDEVVVSMPENVGHIAVLHRTVMGTIQTAMASAAMEQKVFWLGGQRSYQLGNVLDVFWLSKGEIAKVKNKRMLAECNADIGQYEDIAKKTGNPEMRRALSLIKDPQLLRNVEKLQQFTVENESEADITVATVHRAKGLEWENVKLADDFPDIFSLKKDTDEWCDEVNLLYVAVTRAMRRLAVNEQVEMILRKALLDQEASMV